MLKTPDGPCDPSRGTPRRHTRALMVVPGSTHCWVAASAKTDMVVSYAARHSAWPGSHAKKALAEADAQKVFGQVLLGVAYMHSQHFVHRDIKLENVMFDADGTVKQHQKISDTEVRAPSRRPAVAHAPHAAAGHTRL